MKTLQVSHCVRDIIEQADGVDRGRCCIDAVHKLGAPVCGVVCELLTESYHLTTRIPYLATASLATLAQSAGACNFKVAKLLTQATPELHLLSLCMPGGHAYTKEELRMTLDHQMS